MDKLVKGENEMWKMREGTHSNKNSLSISGEESAGFTFGLHLDHSAARWRKR